MQASIDRSSLGDSFPFGSYFYLLSSVHPPTTHQHTHHPSPLSLFHTPARQGEDDGGKGHVQQAPQDDQPRQVDGGVRVADLEKAHIDVLPQLVHQIHVQIPAAAPPAVAPALGCIRLAFRLLL